MGGLALCSMISSCKGKWTSVLNQRQKYNACQKTTSKVRQTWAHTSWNITHFQMQKQTNLSFVIYILHLHLNAIVLASDSLLLIRSSLIRCSLLTLSRISSFNLGYSSNLSAKPWGMKWTIMSSIPLQSWICQRTLLGLRQQSCSGSQEGQMIDCLFFHYYVVYSILIN